MPWETLKLNDGNEIPSIAFGTWTLGNGQTPIDLTEQALSVGFNHIDTAQMYKNEVEAGQALRESGLARSDVFITTKWSGTDGLDIHTSIQNSLNNLGVKYVDLYLIHFPSLAVPDIPTVWSQMEKIKTDGLAKSIGVSNFNVNELQILVKSATIKPAVNQIQLHPYLYAAQAPVLEYAAKHGIIIEAWGSLVPVTREPGGPVDKPVAEISARLHATHDQVLLAWGKAKGAVIVTMSSKKTRLQGYLAAGDIQLTEEDIEAIDTAGAVSMHRLSTMTVFMRAVYVTLLMVAAFGARSLSTRFG